MSAETGAPVLRVLTVDEREETRRPFVAAVDPGEGLWVFAYGSLIWKPEFPYDLAVPARIHGYHRAFCVRTIHARGSPERPGLSLGLERGGSCRGLAFRIPPADVAAGSRSLWEREMYSGLYRPAWVKAETASGRRRAVTFVAEVRHAAYLGKLPFEEIVEVLATALGVFGSNADYLRVVVDGLAAAGIPDRALGALRDAVERRIAAAGPGAQDRGPQTQERMHG